ncbi:kelch-like protein 30 [Drosophila montana]|uniref:kelch-like protein 30 n=1 Tax=Drosophila montana TaxID=40370 RepID=UPI00313DD6AC
MDKWLAPVLSSLSTEFADCRVIVGSKTFECHKVILASASEFFKGMLLGNFKESISGEIHLQNVTPEIFEKFRKYVYSYNNQTLNGYENADLMDLYECGNQWLVPSITSDCLSLLSERATAMNLDGLIELYEFAHNYENKSFIQTLTSLMMTKHSGQLLCERVLLLGSDVFIQYITTVAKMKPETERYKIIEKYLEINGFLKDINDKEEREINAMTQFDNNENELNNKAENNKTEPDTQKAPVKNDNANGEIKGKLKADFVKSLLCSIDYTKMSVNEFYSGPGKSELLTYKAKYDILYKIAMKRSPPQPAFGRSFM